MYGSKHGEYTFRIDLDDYDECIKHKWNIQHGSGKYSYKYYAYTIIDKKQVLLHRFIMKPTNRYEAIDHIDGNEQDNRKRNMRICSLRENICNNTKKKNNTSGYKGVTWNKSAKKWMAYIKVNYKFKNLGYYENIEDAVNARVKGEIEYFKEYANCDYFIH